MHISRGRCGWRSGVEFWGGAVSGLSEQLLVCAWLAWGGVAMWLAGGRAVSDVTEWLGVVVVTYIASATPTMKALAMRTQWRCADVATISHGLVRRVFAARWQCVADSLSKQLLCLQLVGSVMATAFGCGLPGVGGRAGEGG